MVLEISAFIAWVMVGLMAGSLTTQFMPGRGYGIAGDIAIGLVGASVGGLAISLGLQGQGGLLGSIVAAFVGVFMLARLARGLPGRSLV
jgi:uncharacterized membrane protein YeaQ/YmgE (transglycosylase-associated protein family)